MNDYLKFDKFITPTFVQIIWWLGNLGALLFLFEGMGNDYVDKGPLLLTFIAGVIAWRMYCELMLLFFKIYERLGEKNNAA